MYTYTEYRSIFCIYIYLNRSDRAYHIFHVVHIMAFVSCRPWIGALIAARNHRGMRRLCHFLWKVYRKLSRKILSNDLIEMRNIPETIRYKYTEK